MRRLLYLLLLLVAATSTIAAQEVEFRFKEGTASYLKGHKAETEANISRLLSEINRACEQNRKLNLSGIKMDEFAAAGLSDLWDEVHFVVDDDFVETNLLELFKGCQTREIPLAIKKTAEQNYNEEMTRELVINLSATGEINGVMFAMDKLEYKKHFERGGKTVTDIRERREILKFVDQFRSYYNSKDTASLRRIFSDDAIIITGTMKQNVKKGDGPKLKAGVKYTTYDREQYLAKLQKSFTANAYIDVKFDNISIKSHPTKKGYYGVTLKQDWHSTRYSDTGWVFLLWDFRNPEHPQIHVRTWQPEEAINSDDDLFQATDFKGL